MNIKKYVGNILSLTEKILSIFVMSFLLLIIILSLFVISNNKKIISEAKSSNYKAYKPVKDDTHSFEELKNINNDVIGWITIDNTSLDYPVVQGETNETYINK